MPDSSEAIPPLKNPLPPPDQPGPGVDGLTPDSDAGDTLNQSAVQQAADD
ncbi:MAG TPA: hypothetical protein VNA30_04615 [Mycobacteriales bacterium]|nr:hypothetical protein [Mycobacteriales bacterium]